MLPKLSRGLRLALMLTLSVGYVGWHGHRHAAFAKGDDDGGDDDSAGGDDADEKGGDEDKGDDDENGPEEGQPKVTAGGLFTLKTYPQRENERPLTMTQGMTQVRLALGTDLSAKGAFGTFGANLEAIYGATDNFSIIGGITDAYNFKQFGFYAGFEAALVYDLLDIRVAANVHRSALPNYQNFCSPVTASDPPNPPDATTCPSAGAAVVNLPDGTYGAGNTKFSIDLGFPFRYAIKPEIAIIALQTLISIDFNSARRDHTVPGVEIDPTTQMPVMDANGNPILINTAAPNGVKPDLKPSIGVQINPVPQLSVVAFVQLIIPDFDTSAGAFQVPLTARVEFSPSQQYDIGLEFVLLNLMPPDPQSPIDNRFLSAFVQARF
jgi:hypothetical protein